MTDDPRLHVNSVDTDYAELWYDQPERTMSDDPRLRVMQEAERGHAHKLIDWTDTGRCACGAPWDYDHLNQVRLDALDRWEEEQDELEKSQNVDVYDWWKSQQ